MSRFTVNGQPVHYRLDPETPLLWALRDASNLTGTKYGCGTGHCGACTVHVDGQAVRSCRVPIADLEGSFVTTIEALSQRPLASRAAGLRRGERAAMRLLPVPGMIMAAAALIDRNPAPTDAEIDCGDHQHLPLRHLSADSRGDPPRRQDAQRRGADLGRAAARASIPADAARQVPALRVGRPQSRVMNGGVQLARFSNGSSSLGHRPSMSERPGRRPGRKEFRCVRLYSEY